MANRLSLQLAFAQCSMDEETFKDVLVERLRNEHPGWSDETLRHHPQFAKAYCNKIREVVTAPLLTDETILRALSGLRKHSDPRVADLKKRKYSVRLEVSLSAAGCKLDPNAFRDQLAEALFATYRNWSGEELTHHPQEALEYCNTVRRLTGCCDLSNELILKTLENMRKACYS